jgi:hypothetical protein
MYVFIAAARTANELHEATIAFKSILSLDAHDESSVPMRPDRH